MMDHRQRSPEKIIAKVAGFKIISEIVASGWVHTVFDPVDLPSDEDEDEEEGMWLNRAPKVSKS